MSDDLRAVFGAFLAGLGVSEEEVARRIEGGLPVEMVRDHFQMFRRDGASGLYAGKAFFESSDFERLRRTVLSVPPGVDYDEYWERSGRETARLIIRVLGLDAASRVLDFGCGVGRVAKALIAGAGCTVAGVDISRSMRAFAEVYVASPLFSTLAAEDFRAGAATGFTAACCTLVLQHCQDPEAELRAIRAACVPGARLLVINASRRFVPSPVGWRDDGIDVLGLLHAMFTVERDIDLTQVAGLRFDPAAPPDVAAADHFAVVVRL